MRGGHAAGLPRRGADACCLPDLRVPLHLQDEWRAADGGVDDGRSPQVLCASLDVSNCNTTGLTKPSALDGCHEERTSLRASQRQGGVRNRACPPADRVDRGAGIASRRPCGWRRPE